MSSCLVFLHDSANLAQVRAMRCRAADWIARGGADQLIEVGALLPKWVVTRRADLGAGLPPAVFAHHHSRIKIGVEPGAGTHATLWRLDRHPIAIGDPARPRRVGVQLHLGVLGTLAQARQRVMLSLAKQG